MRYRSRDLGTYFTYVFNISEYIYVHVHFTSILATACYNLNTIDETVIVTQYFAIISRSRKVACGTIRGCVTNKNYYHFNVNCI